MKTRSVKFIVSVLLFLLAFATPTASFGAELLVYIGTYTTTPAKSKGIYVSRLDLATGKLSPPQVAAETTSPSFLAIHKNGKYLYAANEVSKFGGKSSGAISAFAIDHTGMLKQLNQQASGGDGPCYLVTDRSGQCVLAANYGGESGLRRSP